MGQDRAASTRPSPGQPQHPIHTDRPTWVPSGRSLPRHHLHSAGVSRVPPHLSTAAAVLLHKPVTISTPGEHKKRPPCLPPCLLWLVARAWQSSSDTSACLPNKQHLACISIPPGHTRTFPLLIHPLCCPTGQPANRWQHVPYQYCRQPLCCIGCKLNCHSL